MRPDTRNEDLVKWGRETLEAEARALDQAAKRMDEGFVRAAKAILETKGKVVVTGLGKSGHIARKIASTFASTGTSAFFIHPSEALHGDLGMLGPEDCLLALAFGGETREVLEVVKYARRLDIDVIAITGNPESSLGKAASVVLDGRVEREVCPLNLAPTASSTLALALGDALAVALMKARGFREQDFASLHPEGSLGRRLSQVQDYMRPADKLVWVKKSDSFQKLLEAVTNPNFGVVGVLDSSGQLEGAVTDGDLRRSLLKFGGEALTKTASEFMSKNPLTIPDNSLTIDALTLMEQRKVTALFVVSAASGKVPTGLLRLHDLIEAKII